MRTYVYIDGFNLYYGCVKRTPSKWLNLDALCRALLKPNEIVRIKYFTARVDDRGGDPGRPTRQETYFRALRTLPNIDIILGTFLTNVVSLRTERSSWLRPRWVRVMKSEEKGSDVNLATHLVADGYDGRYEVAVVITNDSDLVEPIKVVRERVGRRVGLVSTCRIQSRRLVAVASFRREIREGVLRASQFPRELEDENGVFHKPDAW